MSKDNATAKVVATFDRVAERFGMTPEDMFEVVADEYGEDEPETPEEIADSVMPDPEGSEDTEDTDEADPEGSEGSEDETHMKANGEICQIAGPIEDCHVHEKSSFAEDSEGSEGSEDTTDLPHPEDTENPTKEHYRVHFGECELTFCDAGCSSEDSDRCSKHRGKDFDNDVIEGSSGGSQSSSPKADRELSDLSDTEKKLVANLVEEGKTTEEAISMV